MARRPALLPVLVLMSGAALSAQTTPPAPTPSAGTGTVFVGSYSGHITAVDEATETFTKIPLKTGAPYAVRLSADRTRFYVQSANQEHFEVVDVKTKQSLDTFTLSDARTHVRAYAYEVDPQHTTMVLVARTSTRLIDRWEIGPVEFIVYDLVAHKVARTIPWTIDPEPSYFSIALRFSPDGKLLYVFGDEVTIYNAATMAQVETWDLSVPAETGFGRYDPGPWDDSAAAPGKATGLFVQRDAVMNRRLLVVAQIDLSAKTVETFPLGPVPQADGLNFTAAGDRRHAHLLAASIGHHELWTIDLVDRKVTGRTDVPSRTRMQMRMSSSGQVLYLYEAGRTIELYSADASKKLRTIELDSDMMYATFVILPPAGPTPAATRK